MCKWEKWFYMWIENIQKIIDMHTVRKNEVSQGWIFVIIMQLLFMRNEINRKNEKQDRGDGVMGLAFELGSILYIWAFRTNLAKCFDPARKAAVRNEAFNDLIQRQVGFLEMLKFDITKEDKKIYKQKWEATAKIKKICESIQ